MQYTWQLALVLVPVYFTNTQSHAIYYILVANPLLTELVLLCHWMLMKYSPILTTPPLPV